MIPKLHNMLKIKQNIYYKRYIKVKTKFLNLFRALVQDKIDDVDNKLPVLTILR